MLVAKHSVERGNFLLFVLFLSNTSSLGETNLACMDRQDHSGLLQNIVSLLSLLNSCYCIHKWLVLPVAMEQRCIMSLAKQGEHFNCDSSSN